MTKDPICGMTVDETTALRAERDGQTFFFCGESCRKKFLGAPATPPRREDSEGDSKASITYTSAKARDPHCGGGAVSVLRLVAESDPCGRRDEPEFRIRHRQRAAPAEDPTVNRTRT